MSSGMRSWTCWIIENAGRSRSVSPVTTPSAPRLTAAAGKLSSSDATVTSSASAVSNSTSSICAARQPSRRPEPCVAVAQAPGTLMCGREARFSSAHPAACSRGQSSP